MKEINFRFLTQEEMGFYQYTPVDKCPPGYMTCPLDVMKKFGMKFECTDFAILNGGGAFAITDTTCSNPSFLFDTATVIVFPDGRTHYLALLESDTLLRPVLECSPIFEEIAKNAIATEKGVKEVEFGEYPQFKPSFRIQTMLEIAHKLNKLKPTGRSFTFSTKESFNKNEPKKYAEFEYKGKKYICMKDLSLKNPHKGRDSVWVEVLPVKWLVDSQTKQLISKYAIASGIEPGTIKRFLNEQMLSEMFQNEPLIMDYQMESDEIESRKR